MYIQVYDNYERLISTLNEPGIKNLVLSNNLYIVVCSEKLHRHMRRKCINAFHDIECQDCYLRTKSRFFCYSHYQIFSLLIFSVSDSFFRGLIALFTITTNALFLLPDQMKIKTFYLNYRLNLKRKSIRINLIQQG